MNFTYKKDNFEGNFLDQMILKYKRICCIYNAMIFYNQ